jgi:hypothetical protein
MSKKCDSPSQTDTSDEEKGRASCHSVIGALEHQLQTARALRDELTGRASPVTERSRSLVVDYCAELRLEAVEVMKATVTLQSDVCGPAHSERTMTAQADGDAMLERIRSFWTQLPRTRPQSKVHKALIERIELESAAYLKLADSARGVDRKAAALADLPDR